mmetsp:Transcript_7631/g.18835  ORF Transcript_7631/g.18835 Transcript_7631/m.18835 type:complete len:222 (+) Transcript_7631:455-1120(+)
MCHGFSTSSSKPSTTRNRGPRSRFSPPRRRPSSRRPSKTNSRAKSVAAPKFSRATETRACGRTSGSSAPARPRKSSFPPTNPRSLCISRRAQSITAPAKSFSCCARTASRPRSSSRAAPTTARQPSPRAPTKFMGSIGSRSSTAKSFKRCASLWGSTTSFWSSLASRASSFISSHREPSLGLPYGKPSTSWTVASSARFTPTVSGPLTPHCTQRFTRMTPC